MGTESIGLPLNTSMFSTKCIALRHTARAWLSTANHQHHHAIVHGSPFSTVSMPVDYSFLEGIEHPNDYRAGGFHPIHIDDHLNGRYRIAHKLGHGAFSTAWLAADEKSSRYVAIRITTAEADRSEIDILQKISQAASSGEKSDRKLSLLPRVLDHFNVSGPNGSHTCLVTLPARWTLRESLEAGNGVFQMQVARTLAAQLVMALSLVHSLGYAHGDLHFGNLLLQLPNSISSMSVQELYKVYGEPEKEIIDQLGDQKPATDPCLPSYAVYPVWLGVPSHELSLHDAKLLLNDFGVSFRPDEKAHCESYTPFVYRPPEARFDPSTSLTLASDIWSLGCVIFEILAHRTLIDGYYLATADMITAQQVDLQGIMPQEWWEKWEKRSRWYDADGKALSKPSDIWPWERRFEEWLQATRRDEGMEIMGVDERDALLKLLRWMLAWRPSDRPGIEQVLESEWMRIWALPAYEKGRGEQ